MTKLYIALEEALAVVDQNSDTWTVALHNLGSHPQCIAVDPQQPEVAYCGTFGHGLWQSIDGGASWKQVGAGITHQQVMSVVVGTMNGRTGVVYAGTEPSAIFRSDNGGASWRELSALRSLPSASTWRFPPRPWTSHIRWITLDVQVPGRMFAAAEAGALIRSLDGGESWEDRRPDGPFDTHTLAMHPQAPHRLYSAAGDGFMRPGNGFVQSNDGGMSWFRPDDGLDWHYLWGVAVDPADPETLVVSTAPSPNEAHNPGNAKSALYRRSAGSAWQRVQEGLPPADGSLAYVLTSNGAEAGVFYAANNQGIFRSGDAGMTWKQLPVPWPAGTRLGHVEALVVV